MKHQGTKSPIFYNLSRSHVFNLRMRVRMWRVKGITKNVFFNRKCFPKVIVISQFQPFLGNLGLIFFAIFARSKSVGMLFNLRWLQKMFSFTEKVFSKGYSHFRISAIFGEFVVIFWWFLQEVYLWGCYLTYGD